MQSLRLFTGCMRMVSAGQLDGSAGKAGRMVVVEEKTDSACTEHFGRV